MEHFAEAFDQADVDGALAASVFHSGAIAIPELKRYLRGPQIEALDWGKGDGLLPAVVQDADTLQVLMLGYPQQAALVDQGRAVRQRAGGAVDPCRLRRRYAAGDGTPGGTDLPHRCRKLFRPGAEGLPGRAGPAGGDARGAAPAGQLHDQPVRGRHPPYRTEGGRGGRGNRAGGGGAG
ncbi:hypothetical protein G6F50_014914 [Rhizopus delemar]|uniref:Uncharacterized protein n=1 Tax=Rhizopus delemar TaxID=936053 RepID=A0A9P6Y2D5_9FUNG|nr:hypothetical protein G6F50_014914 [Rhizopus delemar]